MSRISWEGVWLSMALTIAKRSRCDRAQVGCVLVSEDNQLISASYNGPAPSWEPADRVVRVKYLSNDRGFGDHCSNWCRRAQGEGVEDKSYSTCPTSHAEINAIARADKSRMTNAKAFISTSACISCAKALVAAGVTQVAYIDSGNDAHRDPANVIEYFKQCGVRVYAIDWNNDLDFEGRSL